MKKWYLRVLVLLLCVTLTLPLIACADNTETPEKGKEHGGDLDIGDTDRDVVDHGVDQMMFNQTIREMHFTVDPHEGYVPWDEFSITTEVDDADLMCKDIYNRALWLEENYGITLETEYVSRENMAGMLDKSIGGGGDEWQLYDQSNYLIDRVFGKGYFLNMADVSYVNFEHPWWVKSSIDTLKLGNWVEFAASDMLLIDKGATSCVFFNIPYARASGLQEGDFYSDVDNKVWTIEQLAYYASFGNVNVDGNDEWTGSDHYGIACGDDPVLVLYEGAGLRFIKTNKDGEFYYEYGQSDPIQKMMNIFDTILYSESFYNTWHHKDDADNPSFKEGECLFVFGRIKECNTNRTMTDDYGILPVPMYSEDQEGGYQSWVHSYHDSVFAVPTTVVETEAAVGATIELLSYYSYYRIQDDFYNTIICGRGTRDQESKDMLKIIFGNRVYDIGFAMDCESFTDKVLRYTKTGNTNLASHFGDFENMLNQHIIDMNNLLRKYN